MKKLWRTVLLGAFMSCIICLIFAGTAAAKVVGGPIPHRFGESESYFDWKYDTDTATLTLSGEGRPHDSNPEIDQMEYYDGILDVNYYQKGDLWDSYKEQIKHIKIEGGITALGGFLVNNPYSDSWEEGWQLALLPRLETVDYNPDNGFGWKLDCKTRTITVTGNGAFPSRQLQGLFGWGEIKKLIISDGITEFVPLFREWVDTLVVGKDCKEVNYINVRKSIEVSKNNPNYSTYNGALYSKDYRNLILCPANISKDGLHPNTQIIDTFSMPNTNISLIIPWGATTIEWGAFPEARDITLVLPDTIKNIPENLKVNRIISSGKVSAINRLTGTPDNSPINTAVYDYYGIKPGTTTTMKNGKVYYFDQNYNYTKGWKQVNGKWYFFNDYGAAVVKIWKQSGNKWYFMQADGSMARSQWIKWYNKWYYVGSDGAMYVNRRTPDGYWVNADGVWVK